MESTVRPLRRSDSAVLDEARRRASLRQQRDGGGEFVGQIAPRLVAPALICQWFMFQATIFMRMLVEHFDVADYTDAEFFHGGKRDAPPAVRVETASTCVSGRRIRAGTIRAFVFPPSHLTQALSRIRTAAKPKMARNASTAVNGRS
jgi:hypothetical protein